MPALDSAGAWSRVTMPSAVTPTCPATVAAGDLLILQIANRANAGETYSITGVTGWSLIAGYNAGGGAPQCYLYAKTADGTEGGATVTCTPSGGTAPQRAAVFRFTGTSHPATRVTTDGTNQFTTGTTVNDFDLSAGPNWLAVNFLFFNGALSGLTGAFSGATGGTWLENYTLADSQPPTISLQSAQIANNTTIGGGSFTLGASQNVRVFGVVIRGPTGHIPHVHATFRR